MLEEGIPTHPHGTLGLAQSSPDRGLLHLSNSASQLLNTAIVTDETEHTCNFE